LLSASPSHYPRWHACAPPRRPVPGGLVPGAPLPRGGWGGPRRQRALDDGQVDREPVEQEEQRTLKMRQRGAGRTDLLRREGGAGHLPATRKAHAGERGLRCAHLRTSTVEGIGCLVGKGVETLALCRRGPCTRPGAVCRQCTGHATHASPRGYRRWP